MFRFMLLLALGLVHGLVLQPTRLAVQSVAQRSSALRMEGVINDSIDKENAKVVSAIKTSEIKVTSPSTPSIAGGVSGLIRASPLSPHS